MDFVSKNLELESVLPRFNFPDTEDVKKDNRKLSDFIPKTASLPQTVFNMHKIYSSLLKLSVIVLVLQYCMSILNVFFTYFFVYYINMWTIVFTIVYYCLKF